MMKQNLYRRGLALLLTGCLLLTSCGGGASAASIHLRKTEGTVGVADGGGKAVELRENLGLYSGYGVDTRSESYAWIDLDSVKLTKLDENSEIEIQKEGKKLEIEVKSGSLFFNVTQPLAEDETLDIRASSMVVGIRGTCGWVEVRDPEHMTLYLLEGTVECAAGPVTTTVDAGKMAVMTVGTEEGNGIAVSSFSAADIPAFVLEEVKEDGGLVEKILEDSGIDILNPVDPQDEINRRAALLEVLNGSSSAAYAGLFDMDGDGREDLLLLHRVAEYPYSGFRWTAYLWNGSEVQAVDLNCHNESLSGAGLNSTDDLYTVTAGVYRERSTGTLYVRYYGEVIGGAYSNYYVSTTDSEEIAAPFWGGGYDGQEEGYEAWRQQKEREQQEYEANLADRFETLAELTVGGFDGVGDYTHTLGEVRQQLEAE